MDTFILLVMAFMLLCAGITLYYRCKGERVKAAEVVCLGFVISIYSAAATVTYTMLSM